MSEVKAFKYADKQSYLNFIDKYANASNAATGSEVDANANVERKTIASMETELYKAEGIRINRLAMQQRLSELFGLNIAEKYIDDLENHRIYRHDETAVVGKPYCASVTLYPFLLNGLKGFDGSSGAPNNLDSFCGGFINLVYNISSQLAGAVATPEFLAYMDHFIRKDYGDDYYLDVNKVVDMSSRKRTIDKIITDCFEQVVYSINQPSSARGAQSCFWNIAYFSKQFFDGMFEDFVFPDGDEMRWESVSWLQKRFMKWFNQERTKKILTFPVESLQLVDDGEKYLDEEWADFAAEMWAEGHSFFLYRSDSVDSLSSCCRLRNEIKDNQFSYTLGAGGISTGSKCVMTINMNRLVQDFIKENPRFNLADYIANKEAREQMQTSLNLHLAEQVSFVHLYLKGFNTILMDRVNAGLLPIYDAGFVNPERQYLTVGINGMNEAAEYLGCSIKSNDECYKFFVNNMLNTINAMNKMDKTEDCMFNTQYVPAENLGIKHAKWDKKDGYFVPRDCYNSYFYLPEDASTSIVEKFILHGQDFTQYLDGGSALHANLDEHLSKQQYRALMDIAIKEKTPYFTFNIPNTVCRDCGHISKHKLNTCEKCGSENLDYATRIIGYLKLISIFSEGRQKEAAARYYAGAEQC